MWNLKVQGTDVVAYNQHFQELALLCDRMFPEEIDKIERKLERQIENKRKFEDAPRNNQNQQPNKRQNTGRAYAAGNGDKKSYEGTKPLCPKCNFNHYGPCIPKCTNCKKLGHLAKDCRSRPATANNNNNNRNNNNNNNRNNNNPRAQGANTNAIVCFECGAPGHFRKNCPQWKNKNQGNGNGVARAYAVGVAGQNPNNNVVTGTFLLNNRCASILFDTGADRSFVSTQFSTLINITPTTLDHGYNVELADGRIIWVNTVYHHIEDFREEDTPKTALQKHRYGHYEYQVMPIGLTNAPANKQEHEEHLKIILELLKKEELYAKFSKCEFWIPKVQFLGHVIDNKGIHVDPAKIKSVKDWASPKTPTKIR
ncbi:putative reverse transcriptase domain-containing protein [Tanacetum coccineum]